MASFAPLGGLPIAGQPVAAGPPPNWLHARSGAASRGRLAMIGQAPGAARATGAARAAASEQAAQPFKWGGSRRQKSYLGR